MEPKPLGKMSKRADEKCKKEIKLQRDESDAAQADPAPQHAQQRLVSETRRHQRKFSHPHAACQTARL